MTTQSYCRSDIHEIKQIIPDECLTAMERFRLNDMKTNAGKFQLMLHSKQNVEQFQYLQGLTGKSRQVY